MATMAQLDTIGARRVDDTAREMMSVGVALSWAELDALGPDTTVQWLRDRLGLVLADADAIGVTYRRVA